MKRFLPPMETVLLLAASAMLILASVSSDPLARVLGWPVMSDAWCAKTVGVGCFAMLGALYERLKNLKVEVHAQSASLHVDGRTIVHGATEADMAAIADALRRSEQRRPRGLT